MDQVKLAIAGDQAFDHHLTHVRGTTPDKRVLDMWFRETVGYRKTAGRFLVVHQHSSVPFDMTTLVAEMKLTPQNR